jgi:hypothetical protein
MAKVSGRILKVRSCFIPNCANGAHESGTGLDFNLYSLVTGVRSGYELGPSPMPWKAEAK